MESLETIEPLVRLGVFFGVLVMLAILEAALPRRRRQVSRMARWPSNLGLSAFNQVILRLLLPASAVVLAARMQQDGSGLLAQMTLPAWIDLIAAILILDLAIYLQHRLYHAVPVLWRFHRMHHADLDFDVTTGIRFHPVSLLLSGLIKLSVVLIIGPSPVAVLVFEVLLNATTMFNHSNLRIPPGLDRLLRLVIVTPDMHRVHHSSNPDETNRNFGFSFPWWDLLFRTYRDQPALGHEGMTIGLEEFRSEHELRLDRMLSQPFRSGVGS
ncbi:MAG: sterol desaturase family protein [Pseudomonadales bacterium]|nr:sterol desaturase family protein [Pseudomonadales bacterium]NIX08242.1 sterol desaturase family protein [Pseudomonadales bacterium]